MPLLSSRQFNRERRIFKDTLLHDVLLVYSAVHRFAKVKLVLHRLPASAQRKVGTKAVWCRTTFFVKATMPRFYSAECFGFVDGQSVLRFAPNVYKIHSSKGGASFYYLFFAHLFQLSIFAAGSKILFVIETCLFIVRPRRIGRSPRTNQALVLTRKIRVFCHLGLVASPRPSLVYFTRLMPAAISREKNYF